VGYFETGADLRYYDEFHGSLITVADEIVETIYRKYFKALISYKGVQRIETYPIPENAFREAIYNAMVHRDYTSGIPIQINVYPDSAIIFNDGRLPYSWTVDTLYEKHRSHPFNPKIAIGFYRAGFIEAWGRGIERITEACKAAGTQMPIFKVLGHDVSVEFSWDASDAAGDTLDVADDPVNEPAKTADGSVEDVEKFAEDADAFVEDVEKFVENVDAFVGKDRLRTIVKLMIRQPKISASQIAAEVQMTPRGVQKNIALLKQLGLVERVGFARGGHWLVKKQK
jgi:ATP-dependent DNA helicase RecG